MTLRPFQLERFYAEHEFSVPLQLSASDCETLSVGELLETVGASPPDLLDLRLGYTETRGAPSLREAIAEHYPGRGAQDVLVGNSPQELIYLAVHALVEPGDRVVVMRPCYASLEEVARSRGAEVIPWTARLQGDVWRFDLDELEELLRTPTRLLVTNVPHNPTGFLPSPAEWERLGRLVEASGARWFSDEMYHRLERSPEDALAPAASLVQGAVSLWGLSKSFGLPGLRLGWLVSADADLLTRAEVHKDYLSICANGVSEALGERALRAAGTLLDRSRARIRANADLMAAFTERHQDHVTWTPPQGGPVSLATLTQESAEAHSARIRSEAGVLLVHSTLFGLEDRHLRIGLGRAEFPQALELWERALVIADRGQ